MWLNTFQVSFPLDISYIPIGLACGILLHAAGFNWWMTVIMSLLVFSGGAQFLIASLVLVKSPMFSAVLMMLFLQLRYALLGSSLSKYIQGHSNLFTFLFSLSLNDENYALNYLKLSTDKKWTPLSSLWVEYHSLIFWTVSNYIGNMIGDAIHIDLGVVNFALTALFLYMIVVQTKDLLKFVVVVLAAGISVLLLMIMKSTLGIVLAAVIASLIGFAIELIARHYHLYHPLLKTFKNPAGRPEEDVDDNDFSSKA